VQGADVVLGQVKTGHDRRRNVQGLGPKGLPDLGDPGSTKNIEPEESFGLWHRFTTLAIQQLSVAGPAQPGHHDPRSVLEQDYARRRDLHRQRHGKGPFVAKAPDRLLGQHGFVGMKTGSTTPAGGCFVFAAHREVDGQPRLVVGAVLGQRGDDPLRAAFRASQRLVVSVSDPVS